MRASPLASTIAALALIASGCGLALNAPLPPVDRSVTCAAWTTLAEAERFALADRMIQTPELLERVRALQHEPAHAPRDRLVAVVAGSVSKTCDVFGSPGRPVIDIVDELYST